MDVIWSTEDPERFRRIEQLVRGERSDRDIDELASKAAPPVPTLYDSAPVPVAQAGTTHWFNDISRTGTYQLAERENHTLIASDLHFDLREATLSAPVTVIDVTSYFGTIEVTVPPGVKVDNRIKGYVSDVAEEPGRNISRSSPTVVLNGKSYGGDIKIQVRDRGDVLNRSWWSWLTG